MRTLNLNDPALHQREASTSSPVDVLRRKIEKTPLGLKSRAVVERTAQSQSERSQGMEVCGIEPGSERAGLVEPWTVVAEELPS